MMTRLKTELDYLEDTSHDYELGSPPPFYLQNDRFELCHDLCNPIVPYRGMPSQKISKCDGGERGSCSRNLQVCCLKNLVLIILIEEECRILDLMVH